MDAERDPGRRMVLSFEDCRRKHGPIRAPRRTRPWVRALYWLLLAIGLLGLARNGWRDWQKVSQETNTRKDAER